VERRTCPKKEYTMSTSARRVKVYEIVDGDWLDQGTGHIDCKVIDVRWENLVSLITRNTMHRALWYILMMASYSWNLR
jgi:hypothetical protein